MTKKVDEVFFLLFCEKNSDRTSHLRLRGAELFQRIGRRLNEGDMPTLASFLKKYPQVVSLDLSYNDIQDEGLKVLAQEYFNEKNSLQCINLLSCDLHAEGLYWLSSAKHLNLQKVRLLGNKIGAEGARHIGRLIENCPALENLDIGETDQTLESIESLLIVIEKCQLKSVNISKIIPNSYYSQYNNSALADDLGVLLKLNRSLEVLRVQKCEFDGHDMELLLGGLREHKTLTMLDLAANRIGDHGAQLLAEWLRVRPALTGLRISANAIATSGAQALGLAVPFSRIRLLDLNTNRIGDQGLADILDSMRKSSQLRMLYIWGNNWGDLALARLERMLVSGLLNPDNIDVKVYYVDGKRCAAYNPTNHYRQRIYSLVNHGVAPTLKISRNKVPHPDARPRALIDFEFINRYPPVDERLGLKVVKVPSEGPSYYKNDKCN